MKDLSSDFRYETRNCAVQTLLKTLISHGALLSSDVWTACMHKVISVGGISGVFTFKKFRSLFPC